MTVQINGSGPVPGVTQVTQTLMPLVGGSPIVESGSNANGVYIKFADGTLICKGNYVVNAVANTSVAKVVTFANTFVGGWETTSMVQGVFSVSDTYACQCTLFSTTDISATTVTCQVTCSVTQVISVQYIAVGRWKA